MARAIRVINRAFRVWDVVAVDGRTETVVATFQGRHDAQAAAARERAKHPAAVALGRLGGQSTSAAKVDAARANGALGGRPRARKAAR